MFYLVLFVCSLMGAFTKVRFFFFQFMHVRWKGSLLT